MAADLVEVLARAMQRHDDDPRSILRDIESAGYRVVSVEMTEAMRKAWDEQCPGDLGLDQALSVIIAAAPKVDSPAAEGGSRDG